MSVKYLKTHILLRRGPLHEWETVNPILGPGEMGVAIDIGRCKIGNGVAHWSELPFFIATSDLVDYAQIIIKTYDEWAFDAYEISKKGQIYIYIKDENNNDNVFPVDIKIGDGKAYIVDLPFILNPIQEIKILLEEHINDSNIHTSIEQKQFWNNKLNVIDEPNQVFKNILIFNRN